MRRVIAIALLAFLSAPAAAEDSVLFGFEKARAQGRRCFRSYEGYCVGPPRRDYRPGWVYNNYTGYRTWRPDLYRKGYR